MRMSSNYNGNTAMSPGMPLWKVWLSWFALATSLVSALFVAGTNLHPGAMAGTVLAALIFPGYLVAVTISGNIHDLNPVITVVASALFWSCVLTAATAVWRRLRRRSPE